MRSHNFRWCRSVILHFGNFAHLPQLHSLLPFRNACLHNQLNKNTHNFRWTLWEYHRFGKVARRSP